MKKKLSLNALQVKSFVTEMDKADHIKGGAGTLNPLACNGNVITIHQCLTGMYPTINMPCG